MNHSVIKSIALVGGGASATLLLAQLSAQLNNSSSSPINIYIIDPEPGLKVGLAYGVEHPSFILNVAAKQMGAWAQQPGDFYDWLVDYPHLWRKLHSDFLRVNYGPDDFVPRMIYGEYLRWIFDKSVAAATQKNIKIYRIPAKVERIRALKNSTQLLIELNNTDSLQVDAAVVATGNSLRKQSHLTGECILLPYSKEFIRQNWNQCRNIIIVGSGLSMVDTLQYLAYENYTGNIQIFSRHGLIPMPHLQPGHYQHIERTNLGTNTSARILLKKIRSYIKTNAEQQVSWQTTLNSFRQNSNSIWLSLPVRERRKLRRALPWWNIARHRIPWDAHELITKLQQSGKLTITKGEVKNIEKSDGYFSLTLKHSIAKVKAEKVIVCSGYCYSHQLENLCGSLLDTDQSNIAEHFKLSNRYPLYGIGPALGHLLFETTAINEIRQQSMAIAAAIAESLSSEDSSSDKKLLDG